MSLGENSFDIDGSATSTDANPAHTYPTPGSFTASLGVTDNGGLGGRYAKALRFANPPVLFVNVLALTNQHAAQIEQLFYFMHWAADSIRTTKLQFAPVDPFVDTLGLRVIPDIGWFVPSSRNTNREFACVQEISVGVHIGLASR